MTFPIFGLSMITDSHQIIYYWPNNTWCYEDELREMTHMSDDYATMFIPYHYDDEDIETKVRLANGSLS